VKDPTTQASHIADILDLADYRRRRKLPLNQWKSDKEFFVAFAAYLRNRAGKVGVDPDGLKRLAVAFDLRNVKLINSLTPMLNEQYLLDSAAAALSLVERLDDALTISTEQASSAKATAYQLAYSLDVIAAALEIKPSSTHVTRR
jgi:hypothetical protein